MDQNSKKVDMRGNPLYPDRIENNAVAVFLALVSVVVAIILLAVIVTNFSYAAHPDRARGYVNTNYPVADLPANEAEEMPAEDFSAEESVSGGAAVYEEDTEMQPEEETLAGSMTGDYVIPDSASRYLVRSDLENLTADQLRIARNEIYARHGRMFDDEQLQAYFNSKSWYTGTISPADFSEDMLNDYERENTYIISDYEKEMGYR